MLQPAKDHSLAERLTEAARFYDYRYASNPITDGTLPLIPGARFAAALHEQGPTRTLPLDTSMALGCPGPATTPGLCANFVRVRPGDAHVTDANATSQAQGGPLAPTTKSMATMNSEDHSLHVDAGDPPEAATCR